MNNTRLGIFLPYIAFVFSVISLVLALTGCKFAIKEYSSSIGELTAETVSK